MRAAIATAVALMAPLAASAQGGFGGFDAGDVCYSWEGGHKSAGSFSRCQPNIRITVQPAPLPPPVAQSPIMMPMSTPAPPPKPIFKKRKPKPKLICRPA